jgi:hypothetical protein
VHNEHPCRPVTVRVVLVDESPFPTVELFGDDVGPEDSGFGGGISRARGPVQVLRHRVPRFLANEGFVKWDRWDRHPSLTWGSRTIAAGRERPGGRCTETYRPVASCLSLVCWMNQHCSALVMAFFFHDFLGCFEYRRVSGVGFGSITQDTSVVESEEKDMKS